MVLRGAYKGYSMIEDASKRNTNEDYRGHLEITKKPKWYDILGLKRAEDSHHVAHNLCKLAESVAKLHDVVIALDARVGKLEREVQTMKHSLPGGY